MSVEEINKAISFHVKMKKYLQNSVITGNSEIKPEEVTLYSNCDFGKWIENLDPEDSFKEDIYKIQKLHVEFHNVASEILKLALTGRKTEALIKLSFQGNFNSTSNDLVNALEAWKNKILLKKGN